MKNVGNSDRIIRIILGLILVSLFFVLQMPWKLLGILGIVALVTGFVQVCPLYSVFKITTK